MSKLNDYVEAAKHVLGEGTFNVNVQRQINDKLDYKSSPDKFLNTLKDIIGGSKLNKNAESLIKAYLKDKSRGDEPDVPRLDPLKNDTILEGAPKEGVGVEQKAAFQEGRIGGGEQNAPGSFRSKMANPGGTGATAASSNNTGN